jgi:ATP-dependent Clp protease ATP-binding subunit ClpB
MTSNLGSHIIQDRLESYNEENAEEVLGQLREQMHDLLRKTIRPEFLNRIDEVVLFKPLLRSEIRKIVDIQLARVQKMLNEKEIILNVSEDAKDWLAQLGYDVNYGARPLKRVIQKYLINPLSQELLAGNFVDGDTINVKVAERVGLVFAK